ncbi:hypothetical protein LAZ67_15003186 [Cordylochernes scorpioides]|uniref:Uncharacterized protein n=1 Tax=Cordylochernes scorpioides TaxID=51811 RepID=A0ABY6LAY3_9ARAC|nr:hypothetical protein LAZ67_15003186 [Cordylochernes scorpioides]
MAFCLRFISSCKSANKSLNRFLSASEIHNATVKNHHINSKSRFTQDIGWLRNKGSVSGKSNLRFLNPFFDADGILRVGGGLQHSNLDYGQKHSIILPERHHCTDLIIEHYNSHSLLKTVQFLSFSASENNPQETDDEEESSLSEDVTDPLEGKSILLMRIILMRKVPLMKIRIHLKKVKVNLMHRHKFILKDKFNLCQINHPFLNKEVYPLLSQELYSLVNMEVQPLLIKVYPLLRKELCSFQRKEVHQFLSQELRSLLVKELRPLLSKELRKLLKASNSSQAKTIGKS